MERNKKASMGHAQNHKNIFFGVPTAIFLWLCVWGTYDTDVSRFFNPGFPHNILDALHGLRSLLPFVALIIAAVLLFKNKNIKKRFFLSPLGLLSIFTIVGLVSSLFSNNPFMAFYAGLLYGSVIVVLLTVLEDKDLLKRIIIINVIIAAVLAVGLTVFFFMQPGAVKAMTFNLLICSQRPYEGWGGVPAAVQILGVAGTRPTGLGRYAGFVAIIAFAFFCFAKKRLKLAWFVTFLLFLGILLFSKGKTEVAGFAIAMVFAIFASKKLKISFILGAIAVIAVSGLIVFYNIPCSNDTSTISSVARQYINAIAQKIEAPANRVAPTPTKPATSVNNPGTSAGVAVIATPKKIAANPSPPKTAAGNFDLQPRNISTLSGRTNGVWRDAVYLFFKSPLIGFGFQADRFFLDGQHVHDSILHALIQAGLIGGIPFMLAFIVTFLMLLRLFANERLEKNEKNFLVVISAALVFFGLRSITESVAFFSADWLFVAPMIAYIQCLDSQANSGDSGTSVAILGNKITTAGIKHVTEKMKYWIKNESQKMHWIVATGMHGIVEAEKHPDFKHAISQADLFVPDGISLVWLAKLKGCNIKKRASGADLMDAFFAEAQETGASSYFYGDTEETLRELQKKLLQKFPALKIAGMYSPPFRTLTPQEDSSIIETIRQAKPDILWVGLGLPKQEAWIYGHKHSLQVPVVVGVGAAFKFLSGKVKRAPAWVGNLGFEWLWRLVHEPGVVWRRIFLDGPTFLWLAAKDFAFGERLEKK